MGVAVSTHLRIAYAGMTQDQYEAVDRKILAVAGVIGCEESKTTASTRRLLLESATFDPVAVRKAARAFAAETGTTPAKAVERLRLEIARTAVETSHASLERIAEDAGFPDSHVPPPDDW